jgi:hypothetical protein
MPQSLSRQRPEVSADDARTMNLRRTIHNSIRRRKPGTRLLCGHSATYSRQGRRRWPEQPGESAADSASRSRARPAGIASWAPLHVRGASGTVRRRPTLRGTGARPIYRDDPCRKQCPHAAIHRHDAQAAHSRCGSLTDRTLHGTADGTRREGISIRHPRWPSGSRCAASAIVRSGWSTIFSCAGLFMRRSSRTENISPSVAATAEPDIAPMPPILPVKREWRTAVLEAAGEGSR